jgi:hypothetical protein
MVEKRSCSVDGCSDDVFVKGMCRTHYHRNWRLGDPEAKLTRNAPGTPTQTRLWSFVQRGGQNDCWPWAGNIDRGGYGLFKVGPKQRIAHRLMYELLIAPIPEGMDLDHLCHTRDMACHGGSQCAHRRCVNPAHLEPVSGRINSLRGRSQPAANALKTHCPKGHAYDERNTYVNPRTGGRTCRECNNESQKNYQERKRRSRQDE